MANAAIVSAVPKVPFRRFLPHEKPVTRTTGSVSYQDNEVTEDAPIPTGLKPQNALLSSEDVSVLMEITEHESGWYNPPKEDDRLYLPFTFSSAART